MAKNSSVASDDTGNLTAAPQPTIVPDSLSIPAYHEWLVEQEGITFAAQENAALKINLTYFPLELEAARSAMEQDNTLKNIQSFIELKKGFRYLRLECVDKNQSLAKPTNKELLFDKIKQHLFFIENTTDTLRNPVMEVFKGRLMNEPHVFIILLPESESAARFEAGLTGGASGLPGLRLQIPGTLLKSFPHIKL